MTVTEPREFDPDQHLMVKDLAVDNPVNPQSIVVRIKQSKTDPFCQCVSIYLGRTGQPLCPVAAVLAYQVMRGNGEGPLVLLWGQPLTRSQLVSELHKALALAGFHPKKYAGYSFRIGTAMTAAACGVPVDVI